MYFRFSRGVWSVCRATTAICTSLNSVLFYPSLFPLVYSSTTILSTLSYHPSALPLSSRSYTVTGVLESLPYLPLLHMPWGRILHTFYQPGVHSGCLLSGGCFIVIIWWLTVMLTIIGRDL